MRRRNLISKSLVVGFFVGIALASVAIGLAQWLPQ
jgi:hypothetical protein